MLSRQVALVSESATVPFAKLAIISAALQRQITRDFSPIWGIDASIDPFNTLDDIPLGYWPVIIRDNIDQPGAGGFHLDQNGQPYSLVLAGDDVSIDCSHEMIEMLVDPFGNRLLPGESLVPAQGNVNYLVEACDPCEADQYGYSINDILVSDFYTPNYFDPVTSASVRYSFTGSIKAPRQVLPGGYLTWIVPDTSEAWQAQYFGAEVTYVNLGQMNLNGRSFRAMIDRLTLQPKVSRDKKHHKRLMEEMTSRVMAARSPLAPRSWADRLRAQITSAVTTVTLDYTVTFFGGVGSITFDALDLPNSPISVPYDPKNNPAKFQVNQTPGFHIVGVNGLVPAGDGGKITVDVAFGGKSICSIPFTTPVIDGASLSYDTES